MNNQFDDPKTTDPNVTQEHSEADDIASDCLEQADTALTDEAFTEAQSEDASPTDAQAEDAAAESKPEETDGLSQEDAAVDTHEDPQAGVESADAELTEDESTGAQADPTPAGTLSDDATTDTDSEGPEQDVADPSDAAAETQPSDTILADSGETDESPTDEAPAEPEVITADEAPQDDCASTEAGQDDEAQAEETLTVTPLDDVAPADAEQKPVPQEDDAPASADAQSEDQTASPQTDSSQDNLGATARINPEDIAESQPNVTMPFPKLSDEAEGTADGADEEQPVAPPSLLDVGATFIDWIRGRFVALAKLITSHKLITALIAICLVAIGAAVVYVGASVNRLPDDEQVKVDASSRLAAPTYTVGDYAVEEPLVLKEVEVAEKSLSDTRDDGCQVNVVATFTNSAMESSADARLTYVREDGKWSCTAATIESASHHATAGVDQQRVIAQIAKLLAAADKDKESDSLASLYHNANVTVTSEEFSEEEQVDVVTLHCASTGTFVRYECDLVAHFRFAAASGAWELAGVTASEGARDLSLEPLVGTWQGTFDKQEASAYKCLAARNTGLTVTISEAALADDGGATIKGTLSGVAHLHTDLRKDADATEGDLTLTDTPFTGQLSSGEVDMDIVELLAGNDPKQEDAGLVFTCTTPDIVDGKVELTLTFGQASAPDAATATLSSTYSYESTILLVVPYQREARFDDHFTLEKVS